MKIKNLLTKKDKWCQQHSAKLKNGIVTYIQDIYMPIRFV